MLTKPATKNGLVRSASPEAREEEAQRQIARKHVERVRGFKFHLLAFLVAMPVITAIWALTEYMNADGWPERFSESAGEGNWNPWILLGALHLGRDPGLRRRQDVLPARADGGGNPP